MENIIAADWGYATENIIVIYLIFPVESEFFYLSLN